jgi:predicted nucleotide-binding protein (sugar kinase/HSP70/actin superfamily)
VYLDPIVDLSDRRMLGRQLFECWAPILGLSREENARAIDAGYAAFEACWRSIRGRARAVIDQIEREHRLAIVVLGRPYHHDPGINHGILDDLQRLGYPILSQSTLPLDEDLLDRLFGDEVRDGRITHPLDILDVWKNASVASTNHKLWAAKVVARHPQLVALELSNFKCGHDAPVYAVIEQIVEGSGTPFFAFKDIDENRSLGSIRIRIETIDYFLRRYRQRQLPAWRTSAEIDRHLREYERTLRLDLVGQGTLPDGKSARMVIENENVRG